MLFLAIGNAACLKICIQGRHLPSVTTDSEAYFGNLINTNIEPVYD